MSDRVLLTLAAVALATSAGAYCIIPHSEGGLERHGMLRLSPLHVNLGSVRPGRSVNCDILISNAHPSDVTEIAATPSCQCTKAEAGKTHLVPGETTQLAVVVVASKKAGPCTVGVVVQYRLSGAVVRELVSLEMVVGK